MDQIVVKLKLWIFFELFDPHNLDEILHLLSYQHRIYLLILTKKTDLVET